MTKRECERLAGNVWQMCDFWHVECVENTGREFGIRRPGWHVVAWPDRDKRFCCVAFYSPHEFEQYVWETQRPTWADE